MNIFKLKILFGILILVFLSFLQVNCQEKKKEFTREIEVKTADSIVKTFILISGEKVIPDKSGIYYWYDNGKIHFNQSGIAEFPLHGKYSVFDLKGKLTCSGEFQKGLKIGEWKYWYPNGSIKRTENYKEGQLKGKPTCYDDQGNLVTKKSSKNFFSIFSKKHGTKDSIIKNDSPLPVNDTIQQPLISPGQNPSK